MSRLRLALCIAAVPLLLSLSFDTDAAKAFTVSAATVNQPSAVDRSRPLWMLADAQRPAVPVEAEEHDGQTPSQRSQGAPAEAPKNAAGAKATKDFFTWAYANGDAQAKALDYVPLPPALVTQIQQYWSANFKF